MVSLEMIEPFESEITFEERMLWVTDEACEELPCKGIELKSNKKMHKNTDLFWFMSSPYTIKARVKTHGKKKFQTSLSRKEMLKIAAARKLSIEKKRRKSMKLPEFN